MGINEERKADRSLNGEELEQLRKAIEQRTGYWRSRKKEEDFADDAKRD